MEESAERFDRFRRHYENWSQRLSRIDDAKLNHADRIDLLLLENLATKDLVRLKRKRKRFETIELNIPFWSEATNLIQDLRQHKSVDPKAASLALSNIAKLAGTASKSDHEFWKGKANGERAFQEVIKLGSLLEQWHDFYCEFDPEFRWWVEKPYRQATDALEKFQKSLKPEEPEDGLPILGTPIGRKALIEELELEMIAYTPEELIAKGEKEFSWCEKQLSKVAKEIGFSDYRQAIEKIKEDHVKPGEQPNLVRDLALESIDYLKVNDLITIPPLAEETWRMGMLDAVAQKISPFFLGGERILISFPTDSMTHEEKLMSLRGNNRHFAKTTVQHELIPGHHIQQFMNARHKTYRKAFRTPFWIEGWTLYWELLLWDLGFTESHEDKIGMLFWRLHRAARVIFSLKYHLSEISADECIRILVEDVCHEPENAKSEVRRSLSGAYSELYQAAYLIGGLQVRALAKELTSEGGLSKKQFHDQMIRENQMPIECLRSLLGNHKLARPLMPTWKF